MVIETRNVNECSHGVTSRFDLVVWDREIALLFGPVGLTASFVERY